LRVGQLRLRILRTELAQLFLGGFAVPIQMGTLGKALGSSGGYICGAQSLIDLLVSTARPFIFSTAPVPAAAAAATAAIQLLQSAEGPNRRARLWQNVADLEASLPMVSKLESKLCCSGGQVPGAIGSYQYQYVGVVIEGHRYIYINAFKPSQELSLSRPVAVCDGGKNFWGVLYDPETHQFEQLAFNGVA